MPGGQLIFLNKSIKILSALGFLLSLYSFYVEVNIERNKEYVAMCDINEHMSCSKAFSSEYGRGFGILNRLFGKGSILDQPNSLYGMLSFVGIYTFALTDNIKLSRYLLNVSVLFNVMSVYLAYILIFVLSDFCILCVSIYVLNFLLLIVSYKKYHIVILPPVVRKNK